MRFNEGDKQTGERVMRKTNWVYGEDAVWWVRLRNVFFIFSCNLKSECFVESGMDNWSAFFAGLMFY